MRVVVVDDQASQREGRVTWLGRVDGVRAEGIDFEEALARTDAWSDVDVVMLDGHDRRSDGRREEAARAAGIAPVTAVDHFVGVRVAHHVRSLRGPRSSGGPLVVLVSAHARDNELLARRIAQAGIDYVFEHYEVDGDRATFVTAVLEPWTLARLAPTVLDWQALGYEQEPDVEAAVRALEASPARDMLLKDGAHKQHPEHEWALRQLRERLSRVLSPRLQDSGGPHRRRAPTKSWLATRMRGALGMDLPRDPG